MPQLDWYSSNDGSDLIKLHLLFRIQLPDTDTTENICIKLLKYNHMTNLNVHYMEAAIVIDKIVRSFSENSECPNLQFKISQMIKFLDLHTMLIFLDPYATYLYPG